MTEAARNFAECVNRVRYQGLSYLFLKNGSPVARLVPYSETLASRKPQKPGVPRVTAEALRRRFLQW